MTDMKTGSDLAARVLASRRGVMCGLAGLGAAGALAACGTAEPEDDTGSTGGNGTDGSTGGSSEGSTGNSGGGTGIAATADVPEGGGIVVGETVLVQPSADEFLAFSAVCPHQGATVNPPDAGGQIVCPRHGSTFALDGELVQGPAETGLSEVAIEVEDGQIFLA